jgi:hypothetical protein
MCQADELMAIFEVMTKREKPVLKPEAGWKWEF